MIERPDLLDDKSPEGIRVFQLTTEEVPSSHVYMEAQIFAPDSVRFVLHRAAHAHGGNRSDPGHRYLVCDLENGGELSPVTNEIGAVAPSVSPDGRTLWYLLDLTSPGGGRLELKRVNLDGTGRETVMVVDSALPGTTCRPSKLYPLSTISSDGKRLAVSCFLGDGRTGNATFGLMVFELDRPSVALVIHGPTWCNMHPQYCRSRDADASRDVLIQENHGCAADAGGTITTLVSGKGADIHVVRDDGSEFRDMPWGRDGKESCQGHQCWIGRRTSAITSTGGGGLVLGRAAAHAGHVGRNTPGGKRTDISGELSARRFSHFGTDISGERFVTDATAEPGGEVCVAEIPEDEDAPLFDWTRLVNVRSSLRKETHVHPFLSPDGTRAFFNSDESGILQAYMIAGLENSARAE